MINAKIEILQEKIKDFCRRWRVEEFALFGSVLRDDFRPYSDIDILVTFEPGAGWTLFDFVEMQDELREIFGQEIDLISRRGLETSRNYIRRKEILQTAEVIHIPFILLASCERGTNVRTSSPAIFPDSSLRYTCKVSNEDLVS